EVNALRSELLERMAVGHLDPDASGSKQSVLAYLDTAGRMGALEGHIERTIILSTNRAAAYTSVASLQEEVEGLRAAQEEKRPSVERILEKQVTQVLAEAELGWLGLALPPLAFQFTEPPYNLILSPRDEIRQRMSMTLIPSLSLETREALETTLEGELLNTSALIDGIGGFSTWPTMVIDRASLPWILNTIAHEWVHTYLIGFPLGRHYWSSSDATAINETVADIVGNEVGRKALERYYPGLVPPPPLQRPPTPAHPLPKPDPPALSFGEEMRITRERVDFLLAEGKVTEAEEYMEERRRFLLENGYFIRRLNQAYFAFHGTYRTSAAAPTEDPIGPRLFGLREETPDLASFLRAVRGMRTLDDLIERVPEP
ncbi:MAG: hypothetical protein L6435_11835, partial [Anaerolineae bacterium]|nr:hypothetical protein [Anaerolineae bacterium]